MTLVRTSAALLLAGLLAACGAPTAAPAPTEAPAAPTAAPAPTAAAPAPASTEAPATAAAAPTEAPAAAAAVTAFRIVPAESQVVYEVGETFFNQNNRYVVAVGTTQQVSGEVSLDRANPRNSTVGTISIDISTFASDSQRRDNAIRDRWLESARFPIATFTPTQIEGLPESYTDGEELTLTITGDLTVRDVTKPTTFTVTGKVEGDTMSGVASTQIKMSDFGFSPPNIAGILGAEDDVKLTFSFVARPGA
jgi:polyisoprenoid-binding protein YceI